MKRLIRRNPCSHLTCAFLFAQVAAAQEPTPPAPDPRQETLEGVEVMRRLVVRVTERATGVFATPFGVTTLQALPTIGALFQQAGETPGVDATAETWKLYWERLSKNGRTEDGGPVPVTAFGSPTESSSTAFHVPGVGAVFSLRVFLPVVREKARTHASKNGESEPDAWERMQREVRGADSSTKTVQTLGALGYFTAEAPGRMVLDPDRRDAVERAVREVVTRFGARIPHLEGAESVIVSLSFEPLDAVSPRGGVSWSTSQATVRASVRSENVVLTFPVIALRDGALRSDPERLAAAVRITRSVQPSRR